MPAPSTTHLVLIPSYNTGPRVLQTVAEARAAWTPVWVVVDGSTDGTPALLQAAAAAGPGLRVLVLPRNRGKGAALLHACALAAQDGFTHVLTMDADGQHPAAAIAPFMDASLADPAAMILGQPVFGPDAPALRVHGRRLSNWCARLETRAGIGDSLFGFRLYPLRPLLQAARTTRGMRGYDFEPEAAIRLAWAGVPAVQRPVPVRYFGPAEGGVSHFRYVRDNALLAWMHLRLLLETARRGKR